MEKLSQFFAKRKAAGESKPIDESSFPEFSPEEEKEIFETLGVSPSVALHNNNSGAAVAQNGSTTPSRPARVKDVVFGTLRSLKKVKVEETPVETAAAPTPEADVEDLGTVRIKLADGRSKWGTLRRHKQNPAEIVLQDLGLEESSSDSSSESTSDANTAEPDSGPASGSAPQLSGEADDEEMYSSVRIKDTSVLESLEQEYGTMRINSSGSGASSAGEKPLWMTGGSSNESPAGFQKFQWRQPEDWELAIIALERGEFDPTNMKDDAFRKYKKERPKLANLADQFFVVEPAPISAPSTPTGKTKKRRKKNKSVDKSSGKDSLKVKDKRSKSGSSSRRKSVGTAAAAANTVTPSSPTQTGGGEDKKERKWAAFKRGTEGRSSSSSSSKDSN